jgi:hypothetical protein
MTTGPAPNRRGVQSFDELMARQAQATLALSGADHSSWKQGRLGPTRTVDRGIVLGTADWDGTLRYHYEHVVKPLQEMFARQGQNLDHDSLVRYRSALLVVLHENAHMLAPPGRDNGDERDTPLSEDPARKALEEGATDAWAIRNLDRYIDELGLEEIAPGIKGVSEISRYQHYAPAADALAKRIGEHSGVGHDEVLRQMNCVLSDGKWPVAVDLMYENSDLAELVPERDVRQVKRQIGEAMRAPFRRLRELETRTPLTDRRRLSAGLGEAAFFEGRRVVAALEQTYRSAAGQSLHQERSSSTRAVPEGTDQATKDTLQVLAVANSGLAPPTAPHAPTPSTSPDRRPQTGPSRPHEHGHER